MRKLRSRATVSQKSSGVGHLNDGGRYPVFNLDGSHPGVGHLNGCGRYPVFNLDSGHPRVGHLNGGCSNDFLSMHQVVLATAGGSLHRITATEVVITNCVWS